MSRPGPIAIAALLAAGLGVAAADDPDALADARRLEQAVQQTIAKVEPAIACLLVYRGSTPVDRADPNGTDAGSQPPDYFGSGVVIDPKGLILTNYHVVRDATRIQVRLPGLTEREGAEARLIAGDNYSDLAVLAVRPQQANLPTIQLGNGEKLRKGSFVVALGHPYAAGFRDGSPSASWGMVSNLRRRQPGSPNELSRKEALNHYGTLIQTDARLQLGQSGGALIDLDGQLVGLTTAQTALTGYEAAGGFAMPVDAALRRVIEVLLRGEEVEYGFLGVQMTQPQYDRSMTGVAIGGVMTGNSPSQRAGLERDDVILEVNGQPVRDQDDLVLHVSCGLAGRKAVLKVARYGNPPRMVEVVLAKAPPKGPPGYAANRKAVSGVRVDYTSVIAGGTHIPDGVIVREYHESVSGKPPRLHEKEIITHVNGKPVFSPADFYREAERTVKAGDGLKLTLINPARTVMLP